MFCSIAVPTLFEYFARTIHILFDSLSATLRFAMFREKQRSTPPPCSNGGRNVWTPTVKHKLLSSHTYGTVHFFLVQTIPVPPSLHRASHQTQALSLSVRLWWRRVGWEWYRWNCVTAITFCGLRESEIRLLHRTPAWRRETEGWVWMREHA